MYKYSQCQSSKIDEQKQVDFMTGMNAACEFNPTVTNKYLDCMYMAKSCDDVKKCDHMGKTNAFPLFSSRPQFKVTK